MTEFYTCAECRALNRRPVSVKTSACVRCGDVTWLHDGKWGRFYPMLHMLPATADGPVSKWMPGTTRPVVAGLYDTRFRHTEPTVIRLLWDGRHFVAPDGRRVEMTQFLSWRGVMG